MGQHLADSWGNRGMSAAAGISPTQLLILFLLCLLTTPLIIIYARRARLADAPGPRSSHQGLIARGGGAAAMFWLTLASLYGFGLSWPALLLPGSLSVLAITGWLDDHHSLPVRVRLLVQLVVATLLSFCLLPQADAGLDASFSFLQVLSWHLDPSWHLALGLFACLTTIWLINLYNFMDGSHGLAAAEAIFTGCASYFLLHNSAPAAAYLGALLAAAALGFLPWNFPRPKIFMGDVASGTLGGCVAVIALLAGKSAWWVPLVLSGVFIADATLTLLNRIRRRQVWYQAHREHRYQQFIQAGWSHQKVWLLYQLVNLLFILPLAYWALATEQHFVVPLGLAAIVLAVLWITAGFWLVPRLQADSADTTLVGATDSSVHANTQPSPKRPTRA